MDWPTRAAVLVVDDSSAVRTFLGELIQRHGFHTHLAGGGQEGVALYREHQATIALAVLDVQMPEMDGPATLGELQKLNPAIPCVFVSGNIGLYTEGELIDLGAIAVLAKPIDSRQLAGILAAVQPGPSSDPGTR